MNILCLDKLHLAGLTNAVKKQLVTMTTFLDEKNKGEFRFQPISAFVYICVLSQSHNLSQSLKKPFNTKFACSGRSHLKVSLQGEYFTFSHEIDVYCLQVISLQLPRGDL